MYILLSQESRSVYRRKSILSNATEMDFYTIRVVA